MSAKMGARPLSSALSDPRHYILLLPALQPDGGEGEAERLSYLTAFAMLLTNSRSELKSEGVGDNFWM